MLAETGCSPSLARNSISLPVTFRAQGIIPNHFSYFTFTYVSVIRGEKARKSLVPLVLMKHICSGHRGPSLQDRRNTDIEVDIPSVASRKTEDIIKRKSGNDV